MHSEKVGVPADFVYFAILRSFSHHVAEMTALQPKTDKSLRTSVDVRRLFAACQMFMAAS